MRNILTLHLLSLIAFLIGSMALHAQPTNANRGYLGEARSSYNVFVFGDSLAAGLWSGTTRMAKGNARLNVNGRFKEGSGLARPRFYDWSQALPKILDRNAVDVAIIIIGVNDRRGITTDQGFHKFATRRWLAAYNVRIDKIINLLKEREIAIYWVEIPPLAARKHDNASRYISGLHKERAEKAGVRFIATRATFGNDDGSYTDKGFDNNGRFRKLRSRDGVHFLKSGNNRLASLVLKVIRADIDVADGTLGPEDVPTLPEPDDGRPPSEIPVFGQMSVSGGAQILRPEDLPDESYVTVASGDAAAPERVVFRGSSRALMRRLRDNARPNSAAAALFASGKWPEPKPGRMDDFTWAGEK